MTSFSLSSKTEFVIVGTVELLTDQFDLVWSGQWSPVSLRRVYINCVLMKHNNCPNPCGFYFKEGENKFDLMFPSRPIGAGANKSLK